MAKPATPFVKITQSRVFQVSMSDGMFTLVLLSGEYVSESTEPFIKIPVNGPATIYTMPHHTWHTLWPDQLEPPGWLNVRYANNHLILTPELSSAAVGGVIAYFSRDERVPINGVTTVTCINCPHPQQGFMPVDVQQTWQSVWEDVMPRLPAQNWAGASMRKYVSDKPLMLQPSSSVVFVSQRDPSMIGGFIGSGLGIAILAGLLIVLVARYHMLKTT
jgi:hypothetical protein